MDQVLFDAAKQQDKQQWAEADAQEVPPEHKERLLYSEHDQALEQNAQRLWSLPHCRYSRPVWTQSSPMCSRPALLE